MLNGYWLACSSGVQGRGTTHILMQYFAVIFIFLAVTLSGCKASAQPLPRQNGGQQTQSLNSILGNIRRQYPGQLSDVQGPVNGRYLIKWLMPDGLVLQIEVDARTGRVFGVRGDRNFRRQNFMPSPAFLPERGRVRNERFERRPTRNDWSVYSLVNHSNNRVAHRWNDRPNRWNR
jgi:hypothetical protein